MCCTVGFLESSRGGRGCPYLPSRCRSSTVFPFSYFPKLSNFMRRESKTCAGRAARRSALSPKRNKNKSLLQKKKTNYVATRPTTLVQSMRLVCGGGGKGRKKKGKESKKESLYPRDTARTQETELEWYRGNKIRLL